MVVVAIGIMVTWLIVVMASWRAASIVSKEVPRDRQAEMSNRVCNM